MIFHHKATPFRAGRLAAEKGLAAAELAQVMPPDFGTDITLLADVSEFQPDIADAVYLDWSKAIIIRAMYGDAHDDGAWYNGQRREFLHSGGVQFLGIYQYLVAGQDPAAQARALARLLGKMQPNEKIIADIEEGGGSQQERWVIWADVIHAELGDTPWDYSGLNFAAAAGLAPVDWVAAYGVFEPSVQHKLWQFTDAFTIPGVGSCDCSVFHGTINDLSMLAWQPQPAGWTFPAPGNLKVSRHTRSGYTLTWDAVTGPASQVPASYSVYTYDAYGHLVNHQNHVPGLTTAEYGPTGKGLPAGVYSTHVWANGAPLSPPHATVAVTLTH